MKYDKYSILALVVMLTSLSSGLVFSDVIFDRKTQGNTFVHVKDEQWQPQSFDTGIVIPVAHVATADIALDGKDNEAAWNHAMEIPIPLEYGSTEEAYLKALYTSEELFIRVRWRDETENREHHPWVWNDASEEFVSGPQIEDSLFLSFEAGCEWTPSLLDGYVYDFDGWNWMAARSDPMGQAVDMIGTVQSQDHAVLKPTMYESRGEKGTWQLKFEAAITVQADDLFSDWSQLDRIYLLQPFREVVFIHNNPDGRVPFVRRQFPPEIAPTDPAATYPQYLPLKLDGQAGEVSAKGHWQDGYWTVEFRRDLVTPAGTLNDTIFSRVTQFSIQVYDQVEKVDKASESGRLLLQFLPPKLILVKE
jgi:hypothetical protein